MAIPVVAVCLWAAASPLAGVPLRDPRFVRLSAEHGLSQDTVTCILQDHERYMWFGTEEGLNRYDGYSFRVFKHDPKDPQSLASSFIYLIYEDRAHRLWVGTTAGLSLFDRATETFKNSDAVGPVPSGVLTMLEDSRGRLWAGTNRTGLSRIDPATGHVRANYRHVAGDPTTPSHDQVWKIVEDETGRLWLGTTQGLNLFDPESGKCVRYLHPDDPEAIGRDFVWDIAKDRNGGLWFGTYGGGISVRARGAERFRRYQKSSGRIPNDGITSLLVDQEGDVWAGSDGVGLLQYDAGSDRFISFRSTARDSHSLSKNVVRSIYQDAHQNLWVGTYKGGVNLLQQRLQAFSFYGHEPERADSLTDAASVDALLQDRNGDIWVGTSEGGLDRFDPDTGRFTHYRHDPARPDSLARNTVISLHEDKRGRIWVGIFAGGLDRFDARTSGFVHYRHDPRSEQSLINDEVWAIAEDPDGNLWLATNGGLDRLDPNSGRFTHYRHTTDADGIGDSFLRALLVEENGDLWIGALGGLEGLPRGKGRFLHFRNEPDNPNSLSHDSVATLHRDSRGRLWVGTLAGGLNLFDPTTRRFTAFQASDGLASDAVNCIAEDRDGHLWLGTNKGLSRFNPDTQEVKNFGVSNGLRTLQFNGGACLTTRDGRLLFGTSGGFYFFDPARIKPDLYVPPVVFTSASIFDRIVPPGQLAGEAPEVRLGPGDNLLTVSFSILDFAMPRRNSYQYRMEGFHPEWTNLGGKHDLTFTNLEPGEYTLQVRASNSDGVWTEKSTDLRITVSRPFWDTVWLRLVVAALLVLGLLLLYRYHIRQVEQARAHPHPACPDCATSASDSHGRDIHAGGR